MAKKKTKVLWLVRGIDGDFYWLAGREPKREEFSEGIGWAVDDSYCCFPNRELKKLFPPSFRLRKDTKRKVRLTQLKNGIKLEKVK